MIIESLIKLYEELAMQGKVGSPGWGQAKVSYALCLDDGGKVVEVRPLREEVAMGKRTVTRPMTIEVPMPGKKSSNISPDFLCHNSTYLLMRDLKEKPERTQDCFFHSRDLHRHILKPLDTPAARAVCAYFEAWDPENLDWMPCFDACRKDIVKGANITFIYKDDFVHNDPVIRKAWEEHYLSSGEGQVMTCLATGRLCRAERVHPLIKGVKGAKSTGATLVTFNMNAFCSYGKEQGYNAPMSQYAAFAYSTAMNYLIANWDHNIILGDTTVLFWAEGCGTECTDILKEAVTGEGKYTEEELYALIKKIARGEAVTVDDRRIDPDADIYFLGISPNAARLSVRFFYKNRFRYYAGNVMRHYERMEIAKPGFDDHDFVPVWKILKDTVNQNLKNDDPLPGLAGELIKSILTDTRYPQSLIDGVIERIGIENNVTRSKAAVIKAFYTKNPHHLVPKEVLSMALNKDSTDVAYRLGRLFALMEYIQTKAIPDINTTIRDSSFAGASQAPALVFPDLISLTQAHLTKIGKYSEGLRIILDRNFTEILSGIDSFPTRLLQAQRGTFDLGYYHQKQEIYKKKENK